MASSQLDPGQIIKHVYDDASESLKVKSNVAVTVNLDGSQELLITDIHDSIKVGDGTGNYIKPNIDGSINVVGSITSSGTSTVSGTVSTNLNGLGAFKTNAYTVTTSVLQITPSPLTNRSSASFKTPTSNTGVIWVGNSNLVSTSGANVGFPIFPGDALQLDVKTTTAIWAISDTGSQALYVIELG